jgi:IS30 family transposase
MVAKGRMPEKRSLAGPDNGQGFAGDKGLSEKLGRDIYFTHSCRSREQGLNKHVGGLLRRYLPKETSFDRPTQRRPDWIAEKINNRPRKALGYRMPNEVFREHLFTLQI